jgi:hypothetical protein
MISKILFKISELKQNHYLLKLQEKKSKQNHYDI